MSAGGFDPDKFAAALQRAQADGAVADAAAALDSASRQEVWDARGDVVAAALLAPDGRGTAFDDWAAQVAADEQKGRS